ncbi:MAG TPA: VOC family protein [Solirubrobacterales bacterium]|nr:VOC family protein [Solirubrobacterales bacterium]
MSERTSYAPGTPCWVDLGTPDVEGAARFYGAVLGWDVPEQPNSAEMGGYRRAKKDGADVAGVMPLMQEGQPPAWSTYVAVADADVTAATVKDAGGSAIAEPMDVMDLGRMAIFADPAGAAFGIWQPGTFAGAARVNETGAVGWNELSTRDPEGAKAFYSAVFGWEANDLEMQDGGTYTEWLVDGRRVGGMLDMRGRMPDEVPPHWGVYFGTEDTDATVEKVKASGGELLFGPMDIEPGRIATVKDPFGAFFNVMQPSEQLLARMAEEGK